MSWAQIETFKRDPKTGSVYINPAKDYIQPFELTIDKSSSVPANLVSLPAGANVGPFPMSARYDGPIEIFYVKVRVTDANGADVQDYDIDWLLEHPGKRKIFMPQGKLVPLIACAGDGGRPYILAETIFLPAVQSLNVTFINNDLANTRIVELVLGGMKMYPNAAPKPVRNEIQDYIDRRERTYTYFMTTDAVPILAAAGGAGSTDVDAFATVPDDTDLEIIKLTARSTGPFRTIVKDGTNDRGLTGNKIHSSLMFGGHDPTAMGGGLGGSGGIFPYRWPTSWLVRRSTQVQFKLDNLTAAPNTVKMVLGGRKVSYAS